MGEKGGHRWVGVNVFGHEGVHFPDQVFQGRRRLEALIETMIHLPADGPSITQVKGVARADGGNPHFPVRREIHETGGPGDASVKVPPQEAVVKKDTLVARASRRGQDPVFPQVVVVFAESLHVTPDLLEPEPAVRHDLVEVLHDKGLGDRGKVFQRRAGPDSTGPVKIPVKWGVIHGVRHEVVKGFLLVAPEGLAVSPFAGLEDRFHGSRPLDVFPPFFSVFLLRCHGEIILAGTGKIKKGLRW